MFKFVKPAGKNEEGKTFYEALTLNEIDKIACEFWGVEEHSTKYAEHPEKNLSWFDVLGLAIQNCYCLNKAGRCIKATEQPDKDGRHAAIFKGDSVIAQIMQTAWSGDTSFKEISHTLTFYQPYIELVLHLQNEHGILFETDGW